MSTDHSYIPWIFTQDWVEANQTLEHLIWNKAMSLDRTCTLARRIEEQYEAIFPVMEQLCSRTCPQCSTSCCLRATVWLDFKDLLFLHLTRQDIPARQLVSPNKSGCLFASSEGCLLPRLSRPWLCTWYLCPEQKKLLDQDPLLDQTELLNAIEAIKGLRKEMEEDFIARVIS
jgi:hypothetical protein